MRLHRLDDRAEDLELLILAGWRETVDVQKFGTVESDAFGPVIARERRFLREFDVGSEGDTHAVLRLRRAQVRAVQILGPCLMPFGARLRVGDLLGRRIDDDDAARAVDDDRVPRRDACQRVCNADDRGDLQRSRHDGGVARARANLRHEPDDGLAHHRRGVGGG